MRRSTSIVLLFLFTLVAGSCVSGTKTNNGGARKNKGPNEPIKIGFSMDTLKEERWQRDKDLVEKHCREIGAELNVQVANGSDSEQIKQAENMLTQGIDVLIVAPHNGDIAASIVEAAHRQNVPVISYDRLIKNSDVDLYISHQVVKMGEMQAQYLLDHVNKKPANFVIVGGSPTDNNALLLHQGQMNVLKPAVDRGDVKIVADEYAKEWQASAALNIVENALTQAHNQVDAVVASNDGTARGAVQALEGQNLAGKVLVSGQDADLASLKLIVEGKQTMTIYKPIQPLASSMLLEPIAVDRNNLLSSVVKDGYHTLEEICAGLPPDKCLKQ